MAVNCPRVVSNAPVELKQKLNTECRANDTANATAAFTQVLNSVEDGLYACSPKSTPAWIMAIGGLGVASGIWCLGYKVIQRVGREMVALNFLRSFCIEFGSTCAIMIATFLEMPVSFTTYPNPIGTEH